MKLREARHYQRADDAVLRISRVAQAKIARNLRSTFSNLGDMVPVKRIAAGMRGESSQGGLRHPSVHINWHHYREILKGVFARIAEVHQEGAELGARKINGSFHAKGRKVRYRKAASGRFAFDSLSARNQQSLRDSQDNLVTQLESDAQETIDTIILDGARTGATIDDMVENIRDMIGLTDRQAQAALNYQSMLNDLDPEALSRQLRNSEYDVALQDAIDAGEDLSQIAIDRMVEDYIGNSLDSRAETIARTEATRAANSGLHDAYSQAIERGALTNDAVRRMWQLGDNPCPVCESIPDNDPDGVGVDEDFESDDGPVDDPPVHPSCECSVEYVTDLSLVPDDEEEGDE